MVGERTKAPVMAAPPDKFAPAQPSAPAKAESRLMAQVYRRCHEALEAACVQSSVPAEFLAALVANESGGNPHAARFEPAVYRHLSDVVRGARASYCSLRAEAILTEVEDMLHPKADEFHARYLTPHFGANHLTELSALEDEALRELSTSWGYTQIMGYHLVGRPGTVRDLLEPALHFRLALQLLAEFAEEYQLDVTREFEEMFRCWNTGKPYGKTFDPDYAPRGVARMGIYAEIRNQKLEIRN